MAKKHYNKVNCKKGYGWTLTEMLNSMTYAFHYQNLYEIMLNRIKWINLPKGCDSRYLEETLLHNGQSVIFQDKVIKNLFFNTRVIQQGPPDIYQNMVKFASQAVNGWFVQLNKDRGVVVYDTQSRLPSINVISLFANRLTELDRTRDVNLQNQKTPFIITGPEQKQKEMLKFFNNVQSNQPAIFGMPALSDIDIKVFPTAVPYLGNELAYNKQLIMNEFLTFVGVDNPGIEKQERMTREEVDRNQNQVMMRRLNYLTPRRDAAKKLNEKFGLNVEVVWNTDNFTDNYNLVNNLKAQAENSILGGDI